MGPGINWLFLLLGKSSNNNNNNNHHQNGIQAQSYNSTVALDPPVRGSYPVAGNGPNVLYQIQQSRATRAQSPARSAAAAAAAPPPNVPRRRDDTTSRPSTEPRDGPPGRQYSTRKKITKGRTLSGISAKSAPSNFSVRKRDSLRLTTEQSPDLPPPSKPRGTSPAPRGIAAYVPTNKFTVSNPHSSPLVQQHNRTASQASRKSYIDLLHAHSSINQTREATWRRAQASGVRNYGEDVADRNIAHFGEPPKPDIGSFKLSYMNSAHPPKDMALPRQPYLRLVPGTEGDFGDDSQAQGEPRTISVGSTTSARLGSSPASSYPPSVVSSVALSYRAVQSRDVHGHIISNTLADRRGKAMSPLSAAALSMYEHRSRERRGRQYVDSVKTASAPPIPESKGLPPSRVTASIKNNSPGQLPDKATCPTCAKQSSGEVADASTSSKTKQGDISGSTQNMIVYSSTANGGPRSRTGSVGSSESQNSEQDEISTPPPISTTKKIATTISERKIQPTDLDGVVCLNDSVTRDVSLRALPAFISEYLAPTHHGVPQEEEAISFSNPYFHIASGSPPGPSTLVIDEETASRASMDSIPDGPVIGLVRGDPYPRPGRNYKAHSTKSPFKNHKSIHPSPKWYDRKDDMSKAEYVPRRQSALEYVTSQSEPRYVGAGLGDLSDAVYDEDELDLDSEFTEVRIPTKGEEDLLFSDSGYGSGGMLPGLFESSPIVSNADLALHIIA